ncbi:MAG: lipoprotein [Gammaproteobacteria bacterium]|jgi:predicted small lipoprotein YifL|nr:lipoprotein [Gammaproteobacteria bacterium]MBT7603624.1 lipoprotein [Gammaproteobacteria bacterium]
MKKINLLIYIMCFFVSLLVLKGCGQTGDLYLPDDANYENKQNEFRA